MGISLRLDPMDMDDLLPNKRFPIKFPQYSWYNKYRASNPKPKKIVVEFTNVIDEPFDHGVKKWRRMKMKLRGFIL